MKNAADVGVVNVLLRRGERGIEVMPWRRFVDELWAGKLW